MASTVPACNDNDHLRPSDADHSYGQHLGGRPSGIRLIILAMAHPEAEHGSFMGLRPEQARNIASWLISTANALDGGAKQ